MSGLAQRLAHAVAEVQMSEAGVARVLGTNPRSVSRWMSGGVLPRPDTRMRLLELVAILGALAKVLKGDAAYDWFFTPIPALGHEKPADLLRRGDYRRLLGSIDALAEGVFV